MYKYLLAVLLFLTVLNTPPHAQAGGGPVEFSVEPNQALNPGEQYVVHARVYAEGPYPTYCKNCSIKLGLQNSQGSDYISQDSERTNEDGRIYAKVISKVPGKRTVYVQELRNANGTQMTANSTVVLNYKGDPSEITIPQQPYLTADSFPKAKVVSQRYIEGPKREVNLAWNVIPGAISYNVYLFDENDNSFGGPTITTTSTSATITINAFINYYVGVDACFPTFCIGNHENLWKVSIQKMKQPSIVTNKVSPIPTEKLTKTNSVKPTIATSSADESVNTLQQKVSDIEEKLQKSEVKQSLLEQRIADLVNLLKRLFPFIK